MGDPVAGLSRLVSAFLQRASSWLWAEAQLLVCSVGATSGSWLPPSCSLSRGLCLRFTVSDSFSLNSGTSAFAAGGFSGGSNTASALGGPGALGLCLMVKLPSSAKGMHSLELLWGDEEPFRPLTFGSSSSESDLSP